MVMLVLGYLYFSNARLTVYNLVTLLILLVNFWAVARIIRQAGYSRAWIAVPLVPVGLTIWLFIISGGGWGILLLGFALSFLGGGGFVIDLLRIDQLAIIASWLFFLVFAFTRWPVAEGRGTPQRVARSRGADTVKKTERGAAPPRSADQPSVPERETAKAMPPIPGVASAAQRKFMYCGWCGEATPGNRALTHNCGDDDRPLAFCRMCGKPYAAGSTTCAECSS